jgi:MalT-like TPR region
VRWLPGPRSSSASEKRQAETRFQPESAPALAATLAPATGERGTEAETLRVLGAIAAGGCSAVGGAAAWFQQGLALASDLGMRPLVAHCHLGLGQLYRRTGDLARADEHFQTALTMYREMGMTFWLGKAGAELAGS